MTPPKLDPATSARPPRLGLGLDGDWSLRGLDRAVRRAAVGALLGLVAGGVGGILLVQLGALLIGLSASSLGFFTEGGLFLGAVGGALFGPAILLRTHRVRLILGGLGGAGAGAAVALLAAYTFSHWHGAPSHLGAQLQQFVNLSTPAMLFGTGCGLAVALALSAVRTNFPWFSRWDPVQRSTQRVSSPVPGGRTPPGDRIDRPLTLKEFDRGLRRGATGALLAAAVVGIVGACLSGWTAVGEYGTRAALQTALSIGGLAGGSVGALFGPFILIPSDRLRLTLGVLVCGCLGALAGLAVGEALSPSASSRDWELIGAVRVPRRGLRRWRRRRGGRCPIGGEGALSVVHPLGSRFRVTRAACPSRLPRPAPPRRERSYHRKARVAHPRLTRGRDSAYVQPRCGGSGRGRSVITSAAPQYHRAVPGYERSEPASARCHPRSGRTPAWIVERPG
jgi:hypothetical protein